MIERIKYNSVLRLILSNSFFLVISIILFLLSPNVYDFNFCLTINVLFIIQNVLYFVFSKRSLISFEFFFMFAFLFVNFIYPVFYFPTNPTFSVFEFPFKYEVISKSTAIAFLAYTCYMFGLSVIGVKKSYETLPLFDSSFFSPRFFQILFYVFLILSITYIASVGMDFFRGYEWYTNEDNKTPLTSFMDFTAGILCTYVFFIQNKKKVIYLFAIVLFIAIYLLSGSRNMPLGLLLILLVSFDVRIYKIPSYLFILIIVLGLIVLTFIGFARGAGVFDSNAVSDSISSAKENSFFDFAADLIINNRNLYVLVDFADTHGNTYGLTMLGGILGLIPYLGSYISATFGIPLDFMTTPGFNTYLEFGHGSTYGLGGNMVADVYLSFGIIGVVIAFFIFGMIISVLIKRFRTNAYFYLIYLYLISASIYINRESYLLPLRGVIYSLIIFWIINSFIGKLKFKNTPSELNRTNQSN